MSKVHVRVIRVGGQIKIKNSTYTKKEIQTRSVEKNEPLKFEFFGDKQKQLDGVFLGQELIVEFEIKGFEYDKKNDKGEVLGKDMINSLAGHKVTII